MAHESHYAQLMPKRLTDHLSSPRLGALHKISFSEGSSCAVRGVFGQASPAHPPGFAQEVLRAAFPQVGLLGPRAARARRSCPLDSGVIAAGLKTCTTTLRAGFQTLRQRSQYASSTAFSQVTSPLALPRIGLLRAPRIFLVEQLKSQGPTPRPQIIEGEAAIARTRGTPCSFADAPRLRDPAWMIGIAALPLGGLAALVLFRDQNSAPVAGHLLELAKFVREAFDPRQSGCLLHPELQECSSHLSENVL